MTVPPTTVKTQVINKIEIHCLHITISNTLLVNTNSRMITANTLQEYNKVWLENQGS